jgi:hypothetical protein
VARIQGTAAEPHIGLPLHPPDGNLGLDGGGHGRPDTAQFDTVRVPPPDWPGPMVHAATGDGELDVLAAAAAREQGGPR